MKQIQNFTLFILFISSFLGCITINRYYDPIVYEHTLVTEMPVPSFDVDGINGTKLDDIPVGSTIVAFTKNKEDFSNANEVLYNYGRRWTLGIPYRTRTIKKKKYTKRDFLDQYGPYGFVSLFDTPANQYRSMPKSPTHSPATPAPTSSPSSTYSAPSRTIQTGPRGGKYYINSNGNKTYIKR